MSIRTRHAPPSEVHQPQFGDGFGGITAVKFPSSVETLPFVPSGLPSVAPSRTFPTPGAQDWDGDGDNGGEVQGFAGSATDEGGYPCPHGKCAFKARSSHGRARHVKATPGGFGGLGKAIPR